MILTDYLLCEHSLQWDYALQCGVKHGVIRLPETNDFDVTDKSHWQTIYDKFKSFGITPILIEPMPNSLHEPIKCGLKNRDECISKIIKMFPIMQNLGINTICFNFMAHIGWLRTSSEFPERGGALSTSFDIDDFSPEHDFSITHSQLWSNYEYFIKSVIHEAEKYDIRLALHPDDPPLKQLDGVSRIMTSFDNITRAVHVENSPNLGVTMCQATYVAMGENLKTVIPKFAAENKILFIHFRDISGNKYKFHETFHDNGMTDMAEIMQLYRDCDINVPIRVDHVPTMAGERADVPGYSTIGRLFAIGYLKGILDSTN